MSMTNFDEKTGSFIAKPIGTMRYFFEDKKDYLLVLESWKSFLKHGGQPTASQMMLYNILRSKQFDRGFSPIKKQIKLDNGANPWISLKNAAFDISRYANYGVKI